ncbi:MAG: transporter substrate-binding domain-containing protein [Massiliimalia sp.]|jgi:ABC-type amino acid transport substrate-binding protein
MKFKKIFAVLLASAMTVSMLAACGNDSATNSTAGNTSTGTSNTSTASEAGSSEEKLYDFVTLDESLADELYGIAVKKDNTVLRDEIQNALTEAIEDGSAAEIAEKWFGKDTIYVPEDSEKITTDPNAKSDKDTIILGCDTNFAPMGFTEGGDEVKGFDIDLAKLIIEEKMGKKLVVQPITWANKEAELNAGKVDVLWNGLTITPERQEQMAFTDAYMQNKQVIVVPKDSDIKSAEDLNGKRIAMQKQSTAVDAYNDSGIKAETTELADNVACLTELKQGRQDAVIMDSVVADYYLSLTK